MESWLQREACCFPVGWGRNRWVPLVDGVLIGFVLSSAIDLSRRSLMAQGAEGKLHVGRLPGTLQSFAKESLSCQIVFWLRFGIYVYIYNRHIYIYVYIYICL